MPAKKSNLRNFLIVIIYLFFSTSQLVAQNENWAIQSITFDGLEKTKEDYLLQFLKSKVGDPFHEKNLQEDIQQLWNVGTNQRVNAQIDSLPNQQIKITFQLKEKKTLLPIVNLGGI